MSEEDYKALMVFYERLVTAQTEFGMAKEMLWSICEALGITVERLLEAQWYATCEWDL